MVSNANTMRTTHSTPYPASGGGRLMSQMPPAHRASDHLGSHGHSVQFYGDDAFLLDELSGFVGSALEAGDVGIIIATRAHRSGLARRLKLRGLNLSHAVKQGRYVALDATETLSKFMLDGRPDAERFANVVGSVIERATARGSAERPRVAAFGEMVALLWAEGKPEAAIELEELWNDLAHVHAFNLRCAYPMNLFPQAADSARIGQICATHLDVIPTESYTSLTTNGERLHEITLLQQKAEALETELQERKKVEESLRQAIEARDEFLSVAAHELKTPITGLQGYTQLLLRHLDKGREIKPERLESALTAVDGQLKKLTQLVVRLLDSSQIEAGKLRIEPARTDLVTLASQALAQQEVRAGHEFVLHAPERLEAIVDPGRLEQVITNLLDNAVKFSPKGGVVTVEMAQDADGTIELSVTDQGVGVPPHQRQAIFERFHQAHAEQYLSGMGLGLYITREIVELHGGSIRVEEPEHPGARFVVTLPPLPAPQF